MYVLIAGGGKVGANLTRSLLRAEHEVTLIEQRPYRFDKLEAEFEHQVLRGDATELFVLERAGIKRPPDLVVAATKSGVFRSRDGGESWSALPSPPGGTQIYALARG